MAKTKFQRELEKRSQGELVRMCEGKGLDHTGDKSQLVARLVGWENSQPEPEVEPPAEEPPVEEPPVEEPPAEEPPVEEPPVEEPPAEEPPEE